MPKMTAKIIFWGNVMQSPIILTFRHIDPSYALESRAREIGHRLLRFNERITQCHLIVEGRPRDEAKGVPYSVKIHLSVPGAQIHAGSWHGNGDGQSDVYTALREASTDAKRQLQELQVDRIRPCLSSDARGQAAGVPSARQTVTALPQRVRSSRGQSRALKPGR